MKTFKETLELDEALNTSQRLKARQRFKRFKSKIQIGRKKAAKRLANRKTIKGRSKKTARGMVAKKLLGGKSKSDLSYAARQNLEKRLSKKKGAIDRLAKKMFTKVKKKDLEKLKRKK